MSSDSQPQKALIATSITVGLLSVEAAQAERLKVWPVRGSVTMPLGYSFSGDLQGFTWGFRTAVHGYLSDHGPGFGAYGEVLLDTSTRQFWSMGLSGSAPVWSFGGDTQFDTRVGGYAGLRYRDGSEEGARIGVGATTSLELPAYVYDFRVGLRIDGTFAGANVESMALLFDLDFVGLIGAALSGAG